MIATRLTDAIARKALPATQGSAMFWDTEVKGFCLRVSPGGGKSFMLDYRANGRQRRITIGAWPDWSVAAARDAAKSMKREVDAGHDPMGERHADRLAPAIVDLWDRYRSEHLPNKALNAQKDETIMWEQIVMPRFGKTKIANIAHEDIDAFHRNITPFAERRSGRTARSRCFAKLSTSRSAGNGAATIQPRACTAIRKRSATAS